MNDIAWVAGIFEGEGSINLVPNRPSSAALQVAMTDYDIILRIQQVLGGNVYQRKQYKAHHKPCWLWQVTSKEQCYDVLTKLLPWLGERRSYKALNTLDHLDRI